MSNTLIICGVIGFCYKKSPVNAGDDDGVHRLLLYHNFSVRVESGPLAEEFFSP